MIVGGDRRGRHVDSNKRRSNRLAVPLLVALVAVLVVMAVVRRAESTATAPEPTVPPPGGFVWLPTPNGPLVTHPGDPVGWLPPTAATDRLVVSTLDSARPLLLIDLGRSRVIPLGNPGTFKLGASAAFGGEVLAFTVDHRTIGFLDVDDPDAVRTVPLPDDVAGEITALRGDDAGFIATTVVSLDPGGPGGARQNGPSLAYDLAGDLRCVVDAGIDLWTLELDRTTCGTRSRPVPAPGGDPVSTTTASGSVVIADDEVVQIHDATTGALLAESEPLGEYVTSVVDAGGSVWALSGYDLVKLDADTLAVEHRTGAILDLANPYLVGAGGSAWIVDDQAGILAAADPASGDVVDAWWLPDDGESDREVYAEAVGDGIWMVDLEQTGEPYRFNLKTRRFERLAISRDEADSIYATGWDILPGPTAPR